MDKKLLKIGFADDSFITVDLEEITGILFVDVDSEAVISLRGGVQLTVMGEVALKVQAGLSSCFEIMEILSEENEDEDDE